MMFYDRRPQIRWFYLKSLTCGFAVAVGFKHCVSSGWWCYEEKPLDGWLQVNKKSTLNFNTFAMLSEKGKKKTLK